MSSLTVSDQAVLQEILSRVKANGRVLNTLAANGRDSHDSVKGVDAHTSVEEETEGPIVVTRGLFKHVTTQVLQFFKQAAAHGKLTVQTDFFSEENAFTLDSIKYVHKLEFVYDGSANPLATTLERLKSGDSVFVHPAALTDELKALCTARAVELVVASKDAVFPAERIGPGEVTTVASLPEPAAAAAAAAVIGNGGEESLGGSAVAAVKRSQAGGGVGQATAPVVGEGEVDDLNAFPWRLCLAGGWLDQPWVSSIFPGSVVVVNIRPHPMFKVRSGLATSTRQAGIKLWGRGVKPPKDTPPLLLARMLFGAENPPGVQYISGSQDALGLMLPGVNRLNYEGGFWPTKVTTMRTSAPAKWLEKVLWLVPLDSRPPGYDPISVKCITPENVKLLADASSRAWDALCSQDAPELGAALLDTMKAWKAILPNTVPPASREWCRPYENSHGYLFSGAGGGFLMVISDTPVHKGFQVCVNTTPWAEQPFTFQRKK